MSHDADPIRTPLRISDPDSQRGLPTNERTNGRTTEGNCVTNPAQSVTRAGGAEAIDDRATRTSLPPNYWIDQIRADLKRRRDEPNPTKPEIATPESESADE